MESGRLRSAMLGGLALLALAVAGAPAPAMAAERFLEMAFPKVSLTLGYEWSDESLDSPSVSRTQRIRLARGGLKVSTHGSLYHRNFLRYKLRLHPEWFLQHASGTVQRTDRSLFMGYAVDLEMLEKKPAGLSLSSQRRRSEFSTSLSPNRETRMGNDRASLRLRNRLLPGSLTWERDEKRTEGFYSSHETSHTVRLETRYPGRENTAFLNLADIRQNRRVNGTAYRVDITHAALGGRLALNDDHHLNGSVVRTRNESGVTDLRYLVANARLDSRHTENLNSNLQVQHNRRDTGTFRSHATLGQAGLQHRLYENLTTTVTVRRADDDQSIGRVRLTEGGVHFNYTRRIPWGRVGATHGQRVSLDQNDVSSPTTPVFDESHTLTGTTPSFLTRPNVDPATVVVTDVTGAIVYAVGVDYTLTVVGSSTGVVRDPLGGIADGQQVLVDYDYTSQLPYAVTRRTVHTGATLDLGEAVHLYARVDSAGVHLRSGTMPTALGDDRVFTTGADVRWRRSTTRLEYEDRDTVLVPSTRLTLREDVNAPLGKKLSGGVTAGRVALRYPGTGEWTTEYSLSGNLRRKLFAESALEARAVLRHTRGTLQRGHLEQLSAAWTWRVGGWNGSLGLDTLRERDKLAQLTRSRDRIVVQAVRVF